MLSCTILTALAVNWTGSGDGISWDDEKNWSTVLVPGPGDDVIINSDSVVVKNGVVGVAMSVHLDGLGVALTIQNGASLTIANSTLIGLQVDQATVYNYGKLVLNKTGSNGLSNSSLGSVYNFDSLIIFTISGIGIVSQGTFINNNAGVTIISDVNGIQKQGILNTGYFENMGELTIYHIENGRALQSIDSFINSGSISISDITCSGCLAALFSSEDFENSITGIININNISGLNVYGLRVEDNFQNVGQINISNINNASGMLVSQGNSFNFGQIEIDNTNTHGLVTNGPFTNTGVITITQVFASGLLNAGTFTNDFTGQLYVTLDSTISNTCLSNRDTIFNFGTMMLSQANRGIGHSVILGEFPVFSNIGQITLDYIKTGLSLSSGSFSNGDQILIQNAVQGLKVDGSTFVNANQGILTIQQSQDGIEVLNNGILTNLLQAHIQTSTILNIKLEVDPGSVFAGEGTMEIN
jgi:hypothetical protein